MKLDLMPNVSNETRDKYTIGFIMKLRAVGRIALATSASGHKPHDWEDTFRKELTRLFDWLHLKGYMTKLTEANKLTEDFYAVLFRSKCEMRRHKALVDATYEGFRANHLPYPMEDEVCWCKVYESCPACFGKK